MTQKELAAICGVSPATVSKALRGSREVSGEVKAEILRRAEEYGVVRQEAHTAIPSSSRTVLALIPELNSGAYVSYEHVLREKLAEKGYSVLFYSYEFDKADLLKFLSRKSWCRLFCGAVLFSYSAETDRITDVPIPCVMLGHASRGPRRIDAVTYSYMPALREAVSLLVSGGRKRIGFLGDGFTSVKYRCFRRALSERGLYDPAFFYVSPYRSSYAGLDGFREFFERRSVRPDAVFCAYDYIAFGLIDAAEAAGISVPADLAVIGADDVRSTKMFRLGLTTVRDEIEILTDTVVEFLLKRIRDPAAPLQYRCIDNTLVIRTTTK